MAKARKNTTAPVANVEALIETVTNVEAPVVDEALEALEAAGEDLTDPTLPMGENGNELVDELPAPTPEFTDADIEAAVSLIEAHEAQDREIEAPVHANEASVVIEAAAQPKSFLELAFEPNKEETDAMVAKIAAEMDERLEFERVKSLSTGKDNIFKNLEKSRAKMIGRYVARTLLAVNVDPKFINRTLMEGSKYSVYALNKLADIANGAVNAQMTNAINLAIVKSIFNVRAAGGTFTMELAKAACSKQHRIDNPMVKHLVRHTVSTSTMSTQASSTMQALETLGVVRSSGRKGQSYEIVDSPLTKRLEEVLLAA